MRTFNTGEYKKALLSKGFRSDRDTGDEFLYFYFEGKKTQIHTKISHGMREDVGPGLLKMIQRQLKLDKSQTIKFAKCPLTHEEYIKHLQEVGVLH